MNKLKTISTTLLKGVKEHWMIALILIGWGIVALIMLPSFLMAEQRANEKLRDTSFKKGYQAAVQDILYGLKDREEIDNPDSLEAFLDHSQLEPLN